MGKRVRARLMRHDKIDIAAREAALAEQPVEKPGRAAAVMR